jgi:hypothetical protein
LTAWGHSPERLWEMTPRQLAAWTTLGFARARTEAAKALLIATMGARAEGDDVKKQLREWSD